MCTGVVLSLTMVVCTLTMLVDCLKEKQKRSDDTLYNEHVRLSVDTPMAVYCIAGIFRWVKSPF